MSIAHNIFFLFYFECIFFLLEDCSTSKGQQIAVTVRKCIEFRGWVEQDFCVPQVNILFRLFEFSHSWKELIDWLKCRLVRTFNNCIMWRDIQLWYSIVLNSCMIFKLVGQVPNLFSVRSGFFTGGEARRGPNNFVSGYVRVDTTNHSYFEKNRTGWICEKKNFVSHCQTIFRGGKGGDCILEM